MSFPRCFLAVLACFCWISTLAQDSIGHRPSSPASAALPPPPPPSSSDHQPSAPPTANTADEFRVLFTQKRLLHLTAVKQLLELPAEKQQTLLDAMIHKIFSVLEQSRSRVETSGYVVGGEFPSKTEDREVLALLMENTCLVSDILLRFPDYLHGRLKTNNAWSTLYKWCLGFVGETKLIDETTEKLLGLAAQELGIVDRKPDYHNPFRQNKKKTPKFVEPPKPKKKEKKKIKKGPRMSKTEL